MTNARFLLLFVDGVGLAPAGENNRLSPGALPRSEGLLGRALVLESVGKLAGVRGGLCGGWLGALDATLGIDGLPQSATGQTTLFTGHNAAELLRRHVTAFPGPRLRALLDAESIFVRVRRSGGLATFANAFVHEYYAAVRSRRRRYSASVCAVLAAGGNLRSYADWRRGEAATWDIEGDLVPRGTPGHEVAPRPAAVVGAQLVALARRHHFTLFETFLTDLVAHGRINLAEGEVLRRLDGLLAGALNEAAAASGTGVTVLLTSDHGNFEARDTKSHTRNPVPLLAIGPHAHEFEDAISLCEVAGCILRGLGFEDVPRSGGRS